MKKGYKNAEMCKLCGGKCCKSYPGSLMPDDIELTPDAMSKLISSGRYAVDWWEGDPREGEDEICRGYFLRPATKDMEGDPIDPTWGGECTFLTIKGCELSFTERPTECRMLEPKDGGKCVPHAGTKRESAIAWIPYRDIIHAALRMCGVDHV